MSNLKSMLKQICESQEIYLIKGPKEKFTGSLEDWKDEIKSRFSDNVKFNGRAIILAIEVLGDGDESEQEDAELFGTYDVNKEFGYVKKKKGLKEGKTKAQLEDYVASICTCDGGESLYPNEHTKNCPARKYLKELNF